MSFNYSSTTNGFCSLLADTRWTPFNLSKTKPNSTQGGCWGGGNLVGNWEGRNVVRPQRRHEGRRSNCRRPGKFKEKEREINNARMTTNFLSFWQRFISDASGTDAVPSRRWYPSVPIGAYGAHESHLDMSPTYDRVAEVEGAEAGQEDGQSLCESLKSSETRTKISHPWAPAHQIMWELTAGESQAGLLASPRLPNSDKIPRP
ncbi:hypothetical protein R3P38DRAFT_3376737 [Favolaschia claudopus]|uniref:Uncharacterized protein n=1 Tax=Favolaschia claudopus TaxID=2862362 RepID=A0AAV9ZE08_9AGAR